MLDESVSQLVHELCHKTQKFLFPVFIDFVRKSVNLAFLQEKGIAYVKKEENPPSAPQIRSIENYWGILKWKFMKEIGQLRTGNHLSEELKSSKKDWSRYCHQNVWSRPRLKNWKERSMQQMKMD